MLELQFFFIPLLLFDQVQEKFRHCFTIPLSTAVRRSTTNSTKIKVSILLTIQSVIEALFRVSAQCNSVYKNRKRY